MRHATMETMGGWAVRSMAAATAPQPFVSAHAWGHEVPNAAATLKVFDEG